MKRALSIKMRITVWYASLMVVVCVFAFVMLRMVSERAADRYCKETLLSATTVIMDELDLDEGQFEIDADIDDVPGVYASLFELDGELLYGRMRVELPFEEGIVREAREDGYSWYVYDELLDLPDGGNAWLRVYMSANVSESVFRSVMTSGAWMLPLLTILALMGGYALTVRAFRPVREMGMLAGSIAGGNDLSRRISLEGKGGDELHALAGTLNEMLGRLEAAFLRESRFASDAAHELRTPLNAMRTQGEYALNTENPEEKDEAVARMLEKNEEMCAMIDQLLAIARMDAGEMAMEDIIDLADVMERIREDMEIIAAEKEMRLTALYTPCCIRGNRAMLARAVVNLLDNAIRYGRVGGEVKLSLDKKENRAVIAVEDDGPGLSREQQTHVFERFWRADDSRSAECAGGTGIGLAIVQSAAHAHGGEAQVSGEAGKGCRFTIGLPLWEKENG